MKRIRYICIVVSVIILCSCGMQPEGTSEPSKIVETAEVSTEETVENQEKTETLEAVETIEAVATEETEEQEETVQETSQALYVDGTQLVDSNGNPVQLKGVSTHGLSWFPQYVNRECFRQLHDEWNANVVRLALYTAEYEGYCNGGNQEELKQLVCDGVQYATEAGLYVIIDWHVLTDSNPNRYKEDAKQFFADMSEEFGESDNVLYEICNEPNGETRWSDIKAYAEEIIPVIRENDEDAIIIVGTPNWSQEVDKAVADPIQGYDNIMYALHFYAASHHDWLRERMVSAIDAGLPVFVTEFSICESSGDGRIDMEQANKWVASMDECGVSYVAWNLSNKSESAAIIIPECQKTAEFTAEDLSESGKWVLEMLD